MDLEGHWEADSLLAVDVGSVNTRASLIDVVEGRYRLVSTGRARSTVGPPLFDAREGVRLAIDQLEGITGRALIGGGEILLMPTTAEGNGVDAFVATTSAGSSLRTVLVGLMPEVSLESARRLAASTYLNVTGEIHQMDGRREDERLDLILRARPDLVIVVGGTDGGAGASVLEMIDLVSLATDLIPDSEKPQVIYAGNRVLGAPVSERFSDPGLLALTPNVRPDLTAEDLAPVRARLGEHIAEQRAMRIAGYDELIHWSSGELMPTADAFGRVVRYLSQVYDPDKGVLGVDIGGTHMTVAAAFNGDLRVSVRSDLGLGDSLPGLLKFASVPEVVRWLPIEVDPRRVLDYIHNKAIEPASVPMTLDDLHVEFALARELMRVGLELARPGWPSRVGKVTGKILPALEPVLASGAVLARAPHPGYAALALLDALQPVGITTLVLDPHSIAPALGAAALVMPMATVQVLSSGNFVSLGTVVAPVGRARQGRPAVQVRLERDLQSDSLEGEARFGQLIALPLGLGETGRLTLRPERGFDVGFGGPGKAGSLKVAGGALGLIIDARGRPIELPPDDGTRVEVNRKWLWDIGVEL